MERYSAIKMMVEKIINIFFHEKKFNFIIRALGGRYMSLSDTHTFQHVKKKGS